MPLIMSCIKVLLHVNGGSGDAQFHAQIPPPPPHNHTENSQVNRVKFLGLAHTFMTTVTLQDFEHLLIKC